MIYITKQRRPVQAKHFRYIGNSFTLNRTIVNHETVPQPSRYEPSDYIIEYKAGIYKPDYIKDMLESILGFNLDDSKIFENHRILLLWDMHQIGKIQEIVTVDAETELVDSYCDVPARITLDKNGKITSHMWFLHGMLHRNHGNGDMPAAVYYFPDSRIKANIWYVNGNIHRYTGNYTCEFYKNKRRYYMYKNLVYVEGERPVNSESPYCVIRNYRNLIVKEKYLKNDSKIIKKYTDKCVKIMHLNALGQLNRCSKPAFIIEYWSDDGELIDKYEEYYKNGMRAFPLKNWGVTD